MNKLSHIFTYSLLVVCVLAFNYACTEYDTPAEIADDGTIDTGISTKIHRKVLWINIDGAVGEVVKNSLPADGAIAKMLKNSKYSWAGVSDNRTLSVERNEDPVTWATMLTGVIPEKHSITDDSYTANVEYNPNNPNEKVIHYQNVISYISNNDVNMLSLCVTPWAKLNKNMLNNAKTTITSENDVQTRDVVLNHIVNEDYTFILADFSGMLEAGKSGGFKADNASYVSALKTIDGYIGEFLSAIDARENAFYEDWLIVVTSNHGGSADGRYGGASEVERNTFGLFFYNHYTEKHLNGNRLYGAYFDSQNEYKAVVFDSIGKYYSLGMDAFSMEIIMRMVPRQDGTYNGNNWDRILGKAGWGLYRQRGTVSMRTNPKEGPALEQAITGYNDSKWHHYGVSISSAASGRRKWLITLDGKLQGSGATDTQGLAPDSSLFAIGGYSVPTSYYISEVRLWKKDLAEREFLQLSGEIDIEPSGDMLGYWKFKPTEQLEKLEEDTLVIKNQIQGGLNMYYIKDKTSSSPDIEQKASAMFANTLPTNVNAERICVENTLIVPQILYWLGISAPSTLDGYVFINNYALSEEWREEVDTE